jgi:alcohol dehydrogenase class IV
MVEQIGKFLTTQVIYHGPGALARLEGEIRKLGGKKLALLTDQGVAHAGLRDKVAAAIGADLCSFDQIPAEPPYEIVEQCVAAMRDNHCNLVVALGGGSVIDTSKMAALLMANGGQVTDYFGVDKLALPGLPVIAIPTTAGTGSEVSPACVFVDSRDHTKKGVRSDFVLPRAAILDPELTLSLPQRLTASTGMDALTHAIECYTSPRATLINDLVAEKAVALIGENLRAAYARGQDLAARNGMLMGSLLAGMALAIANVGVVHGLAQTIGGMVHVPHGVANALLLPYVMAYNRIGCREKYAKVAMLLGEKTEGLSLEDASLAAVAAVRGLVQDLQLPQRLREVEVPEDLLQTVARRCMETQTRVVTNNPRTVTEDEALELLKRAW